MNSISVPLLPTSLWLLATALLLILLIMGFSLYWYYRNRLQSLVPEAKSTAELAARKDMLQADVDALRQWFKEQQDEIQRIQSEREEQERIRQKLSELEQMCAQKDNENETLRKEVGDLESRRSEFIESREKLEKEVRALKEKQAESETIEKELAQNRSERDRLRAELQDAITSLNNAQREKAERETALEQIQKEYDSKKAEFDSLNEKMASLEERKDEIAETETKLSEGRKELENIYNEAQKAQADLSDLVKEKADAELKLDGLRNENNRLEGKQTRLNERIEELNDKAKKAAETAQNNSEQMNHIQEELKQAQQELQRTWAEKQKIEIANGEMNARKAALEREIEEMKAQIKPGAAEGKEEDPLAPYTDLLVKEPSCLFEEMFSEALPEQEEARVLRKLKNGLKESGLLFPSRVIDAFHTCLKCHDINPLTVLAGVSGTGKTLLPVAYARLMGMHNLVMAVQPGWDSPQDMFGFFNYLENRYKATELARAMVRMDPYNFHDKKFKISDSQWTQERMLLVLMDEMNLARTEYYFSDFLSRLELRRTISSPENKYKRSEAEIELDAGPSEERFTVWVPENILFVGTMNEDETTQALSDKVLDRSNVMRFGMPDEKSQPIDDNIKLNDSSGFMPYEVWRNWQRQVTDDSEVSDQVNAWLSQINLALNNVARPFGYRLQKAIHKYVANYPSVHEGERFKMAFADQIEYKIMPRLRGLDMADNSADQCLQEIGDIVSNLDDRQLETSFQKAQDESHHLGLFQWHGITRPIEGDED
jgi:peptidoglycan hydrolase CwlO-like protein